MEKTREERLAMLADLMYIGCGLSIWGFDTNGRLYYSTCPHEEETLFLFQNRGFMAYALEQINRERVPFVMGDALGLLWVGEYAPLSSNGMEMLVVLGPVCSWPLSTEKLRDTLRQTGWTLALQERSLEILREVPVLSVNSLHQYIKMLHYSITEETISPSRFRYQDVNGEKEERGGVDREPVASDEYEQDLIREKTIFQCVREGNLHYAQIIDRENKDAMPWDLQLDDPLREPKDMALLLADLCRRAAVEGNLPIQRAREMEKNYIRRIEKSSTLAEVLKTQQDLLEEYVTCVYRFQSRDAVVSGPVQKACDYIRTHFTGELSLKAIAKHVGYTEYYLSRKFQRETGMKIGEYIKAVRLEYAKVWLVTTEKSIQEISEKAQFGTRNYFSRVFREREGMTPQEYRERANRIQKSGPFK